MARKLNGAGKQKDSSMSRRQFLKLGAGATALPFALVIPSNAAAVVTTEERLLPFRARQSEFYARLREKVAQMPQTARTGPVPIQPPPTRQPYNTPSDTSVNTQKTVATFSGTPSRSDDTNYETVYDGSKTDFITDYR